MRNIFHILNEDGVCPVPSCSPEGLIRETTAIWTTTEEILLQWPLSAILLHYSEAMAKLAPHQVEEVNEIIAKIQKAVKPKCEIGAQSRNILKSQLAVHKIKKKVVFFKSRPEYSDEIVNYFVNEKKVARNRFHMNSREDIYLLF